MKDVPFVTASEISEYLYCKRGWWLRKHSLLENNPQMLQGISEHNKLLTKVTLQRPIRRLAILLLLLGILGILLLILTSS